MSRYGSLININPSALNEDALIENGNSEEDRAGFHLSSVLAHLTHQAPTHYFLMMSVHSSSSFLYI